MKNQILITTAFVGIVSVVGFTTLPSIAWERAELQPRDSAERGTSGVPDVFALRPIPAPKAQAPKLVALGERLFHEVLLSSDGSVSCATCHDLASGGADGLRVSVGVGGSEGERNSPTVFNCALNFRQFWDGRAFTLEDQVDGPITNPKEMGSSWEVALAALRADSSYVAGFDALWADGITIENVSRAIAAFERTLVTPDSRFDRYLAGELDALTTDEVAGYELFLELGCSTCHQGMNIGGNLFQRMGAVGNFFEDRGELSESDQGRYNQTKRGSDLFKFKVPSLRTVARTAPYFHDGSVPTLEQAVRIMGQYQLGLQLSVEEVSLLVAFLHSLDAPVAR